MKPSPNQTNARQRVTLACNACRVKRIKCDGDQPRCTACKTRAQQCEYDHSTVKRRPPSNQYIKALLARIDSLEEALSSLSPAQPETPKVGTLNPSSALSTHSASQGCPQTDSQIGTILGATTSSPGRFDIGETGQLRYFYSRNHVLLSSDSGISTLDARYRGYAAAQQLVGIADVSNDLRNHLLSLFWCWQNSWHYLVPEQAFLRDLHVEHSGRFCSPLLLLAIFAVASRYSDRPDVRLDVNEPDTAGASFAAQAKVMLHYEIESPTMMTVQAAALLSIREMALDMESSGWVYCGLATRMAFNLGLHLDCSSAVANGIISSDEAEVRSITWWGCYMLEQMFSVGWGRPATIPYHSITAQRPSRLNELEHRLWRPTSQDISDLATSRSYCVSNSEYICDLFRITSEVLNQDHVPKTNCSQQDIHVHITQSHLRLVSFYRQLPAFLKISPSSSHPSVPHIYLLHLQYHTAMVLLHRPFFQMFHRGVPDIDREAGSQVMHVEACRSSAEWISNILRIYKANYTLRHIPIIAVHCAVTAATIHLVDTTSSDADVRKKGIQRLQTCVLSLREMRTAWASSTRCIKSIQRLANECNAGAEASNIAEGAM